MPNETAVFWLVVAAFLFFDNLIIVPHGCELLRFGRRGHLRYDASSRLSAAGKEMVFLNPLNLFDRGLVTTRCFGDVEPRKWRQGLELVHAALPTLNGFSTMGYVYLVLVVVLAALSFRIGFTPALIGFVGLHLLVWVAAVVVLIVRRRQLLLSGSGVLGAAAEALFVPAYLMNLGKRLVYKRRVGISALGLGLRQLKRTVNEDDRDGLALKLSGRLELLEMTQGQEVDEASRDDTSPWDTRLGELGAAGAAAMANLSATQQWIMEAKACLKT
jgi:hypothetical protein